MALRVTRAGRHLVEGGQALRLVFQVTAKTKGDKATQTGELTVTPR